MSDAAEEPKRARKGRPIALDLTAASSDPNLPAFLARPEGAPVYHGFPILDDVEVEGFRLGMITGWEAVPDTLGDAFVVAPDNTRCGLVWEVTDRDYFEEVSSPTAIRWGVWAVAFPHEMQSREDARRNLAAILPRLREQWLSWRSRSGQ